MKTVKLIVNRSDSLETHFRASLNSFNSRTNLAPLPRRCSSEISTVSPKYFVNALHYGWWELEYSPALCSFRHSSVYSSLEITLFLKLFSFWPDGVSYRVCEDWYSIKDSRRSLCIFVECFLCTPSSSSVLRCTAEVLQFPSTLTSVPLSETPSSI